MEHVSPLFATFILFSWFISDYKSNIKQDFTLLESYFINNGEDIVETTLYKSHVSAGNSIKVCEYQVNYV